MSELKACPHCAGSDIRIDKHPNRDGGYLHSHMPYIYSMCCYDCGATFPNCYSREKMVEQWNRRTPAVNANREMTYEELLSTYAGQCQLTDELAAKLEAGSDKALLSRIAELEADLATMNKRYSAAIAAKPQPDQPAQEDRHD